MQNTKTPLRELMESAEHLALHQKLLLEAAQLLVASLDFNDIKSNLLRSFERLQPALPHDAFAVLLLDEQDQTLRSVVALGLAHAIPDNNSWAIPLGDNIISQAIRSGHAELVNDAHLDPRTTYPSDTQVAHEHLMCMPMLLQEQILGALVISRFSDPPFPASDFELGQLLARYVTLALEHAQLYAQVQEMATTDELTGLFNRRHFFTMAELEWQRARRYRYPLSVLMLDVDNFKRINELYGRAAGDQVLKVVAQTCQNSLRIHDILGRYDGEAFAMLLPHTGLAAAVDVAERLRRRLQNTTMTIAQGNVNVTVSLGLSAHTDEITSLATLLEQSNQALSEAKTLGRNRVAIR